jgi:hypothetical protein
VQRAKRPMPRRRFSPLALPRTPVDRRRTGRAPPRPRRPRRRQAAASLALRRAASA